MNTQKRFDFDKWVKDNAIHYTGSIEYRPKDVLADWAESLNLNGTFFAHGNRLLLTDETKNKINYFLAYGAGKVYIYRYSREDVETVCWEGTLALFMDTLSKYNIEELIEKLSDKHMHERAAKLQDTITYIVSDFLKSEQFIRELRESDVVTESRDWGQLLEMTDEVADCGIGSLVTNHGFEEAYSSVIKRALSNKL